MEKNKLRKIGVLFGLVFATLTLSVYVIFDSYPDIVNLNNGIDERHWHVIARSDINNPLGTENPSASSTDFLEIFYINLSDGDNYYTNENDSVGVLENYCEANGLGWVNADNVELDIAHSTAFAILVKVQGDEAHCKRDTTWWDTDLNCTLTWTAKSETDAQPDYVTSYPDALFNTSSFTYLYKIFVWDNGGTGYTIAKGSDSGTEPIFELSAYY